MTIERINPDSLSLLEDEREFMLIGPDQLERGNFIEDDEEYDDDDDDDVDEENDFIYENNNMHLESSSTSDFEEVREDSKENVLDQNGEILQSMEIDLVSESDEDDYNEVLVPSISCTSIDENFDLRCIIGAQRCEDDDLNFLVKWRHTNQLYSVPGELLYARFPNKVVNFLTDYRL